MKYSNTVEAVFVERPNRFIGIVEIEGKRITVHIKNTGRCRELLEKGNTVFLEHIPSVTRKTEYDLVAVKRRDGKHINMDSMAPNQMAQDWLLSGALGDITELKPETVVGNSRYDFSCKCDGKDMLVEVKGCTLERKGIALFPDAPTVRGTKHVRGMIDHVREGVRCVVLFVIQMKGISVFKPNVATDSDFAKALKEADDAGVEIIAVDSIVGPGYAVIDHFIPVEM